MQELERALAVDLVEAVEEFDVGAVAEAERVVHPADFGVFVGDPFVGSDAVPVAAFDHERSRGEQRDHLGVVERRAHVEVRHLPLDREQEAVLGVGRTTASVQGQSA